MTREPLTHASKSVALFYLFNKIFSRNSKMSENGDDGHRVLCAEQKSWYEDWKGMGALVPFY